MVHRPSKKLVRDKIPALIAAEGRTPNIRRLRGAALQRALVDKLAEEHAEFLAETAPTKKAQELADIVEVAMALARGYGLSRPQFLRIVDKKRTTRGGFSKGYLYLGDR